MTASRFSLAPLGDPGSVRIKLWFRTPATGRDMTATSDKLADVSKEIAEIIRDTYTVSPVVRRRACRAFVIVSPYG